MAISQNQLRSLVKEAAMDLADILKAEKPVAKALDVKDDVSPDASPLPKDSDGLPSAEDAAAATAPKDPASEVKDVPGGEAPIAPEAEAPAAEAGAGGDDFLGALQGAYSELDDEELCDHYIALKSVLYGRMGKDDGAGDPAAVAAPAAPAMPAPADKALELNESCGSISKAEGSVSKSASLSKDSMGAESGSEMAMAEGSAQDSHENGGQIKKGTPAVKGAGAGSEKVADGGTGRLAEVGKAKGAGSKDRLAQVGKADGAASKDRLAEVGAGLSKAELAMQEELKLLTKAVDILVNQPLKKSVSDRFELNKNAAIAKQPAVNLSKSEIHEKLVALTKSDKLSGDERTLINDYYYGVADADQLSALINKQ